MAKIRLPYIERTISKGRVYFRYRRKGQRIPLPHDPGSPDFMALYQEINASFTTAKDPEQIITPGSIAALIVDFKKSGEYSQFGPSTKKLYTQHLDEIRHRFGKFPVRGMTRNVVLTYRDANAAMPGKANNALKIMSRLFSFAVDRNMTAANPCARIKKLKMGTHRPWSLEEVALFKKAAPPHMRLMLMLALYSGQRQADLIKMRWNQIRDNGIELKQGKTGAELWIPLHRALRRELDLTKRQAISIATTVTGKPWSINRFASMWKKATRKAGLPDDCVFHGLRKTAAVYLAEAGCTDEQIQSITGHATKRMVEHYTKGANQKLLARAAIKKFERRK